MNRSKNSGLTEVSPSGPAAQPISVRLRRWQDQAAAGVLVDRRQHEFRVACFEHLQLRAHAGVGRIACEDRDEACGERGRVFMAEAVQQRRHQVDAGDGACRRLEPAQHPDPVDPCCLQDTDGSPRAGRIRQNQRARQVRHAFFVDPDALHGFNVAGGQPAAQNRQVSGQIFAGALQIPIAAHEQEGASGLGRHVFIPCVGGGHWTLLTTSA